MTFENWDLYCYIYYTYDFITPHLPYHLLFFNTTYIWFRSSLRSLLTQDTSGLRKRETQVWNKGERVRIHTQRTKWSFTYQVSECVIMHTHYMAGVASSFTDQMCAWSPYWILLVFSAPNNSTALCLENPTIWIVLNF